MKSIDEDIKNGSFQRVYLLYGEESYLKRQYKQKLKNALAPSGDTLNAAYYEGKNCNIGEMIDLAETLPFLAEYIKHIAETTVFVFEEEDVDKRSKMYKAVKNAGRAVEFARQKDALLVPWILGRLKRENKKITQSVMQLFLEKTGNDMENIDRELEKLFCYTLGKEVISAEDVEAVCTVQTTGRIFEMISCIAEGKRKQALELYYDLLALKEPPMRILFLIARQFQILLQVKELGRQGYDHKFIASKAGIPEFTVRRNLSQSGRFTTEQLKNTVLNCVKIEESVKTGNLNDRMAVELLIVGNTI